MKVSVFGSGYVGLVAGACFAESGNEVICVDVNTDKIADLNNGIIPIYEPGLEEMIKRNVRQQRLTFTTDSQLAVTSSLFQFIAVGTPPGEDGSADLKYVLKVAETIGTFMDGYKVVVNKSTVPVGTADQVNATLKKALGKRGLEHAFDVVSNPEFLKEGVAISDFMYPDRVVIGSENIKSTALMKDLYTPFLRGDDNFLLMDIRSAEMTKYAANSMLATKISFMNEIANLCQEVNANVDQVRLGIGSDSRIGQSFLFPGVGYGGSCFPKDVQALIRTGGENSCPMDILQAVESVNNRQKSAILKKIDQVFEDISDLTFGVWGLSFKPQTDDMREAPSIVTINRLIEKGVKVVVNDPEALSEARSIWGDKIVYQENYYDVLPDVDGLLILTEWNDYRRPDFERIKQLMKSPLIFDGRNLYDPRKMKERGFEYHSIGRS
ncbi:MAG: UDP-glucose/GDP-mannose dehydrogenase family protein [Proteobacteria bacterium]|nr:UDP-glucose/GDP-mannose dehydrogenase family protein [Pseudomonadota bacterium]